MIRAVAAVIVALFAACPAAAQDRLTVLLGSHHADARIQFNEFTPGLFLTWERGLDYSIGGFLNSFGRPSVAATIGLPVLEWPEGRIGLFAGAAYYPDDGRRFAISLGDVVPIGGVQLRHRNLFAQIMPSDGRATSVVFSVGMTFSLSEIARAEN